MPLKYSHGDDRSKSRDPSKRNFNVTFIHFGFFFSKNDCLNSAGQQGLLLHILLATPRFVSYSYPQTTCIIVSTVYCHPTNLAKINAPYRYTRMHLTLSLQSFATFVRWRIDLVRGMLSCFYVRCSSYNYQSSYNIQTKEFKNKTPIKIETSCYLTFNVHAITWSNSGTYLLVHFEMIHENFNCSY